MLDLTRFAGQGPIQSRDIATRQDVPEPYLNQLLTLLRKAGLITSRRGPGGGHSLARPAHTITLAEVVAALDGPTWVGGSEESGQGTRRTTCYALREVWQEIDAATQQILSGITLAELLDRERRRTFTYQI